MKEKNNNKNLPESGKGEQKQNALSGYPLYPSNEDIYKMFKEEENINPEDISEMKVANDDDAIVENEKVFMDNLSGNDLDVPGSELDDEDEEIGSEDEENNYYSLGGDDHNDLEEDEGE